MGRRLAIFAFSGEPMCFGHALLNARDMSERGFEVRLVVEGMATAQLKELDEGGRPFSSLFSKVRDMGLIDCVCQACASKTGALDSVTAQGLPLCNEMAGHPSMARYIEEGFEIVTF